jgi:hypothetical protein
LDFVDDQLLGVGDERLGGMPSLVQGGEPVERHELSIVRAGKRLDQHGLARLPGAREHDYPGAAQQLLKLGGQKARERLRIIAHSVSDYRS